MAPTSGPRRLGSGTPGWRVCWRAPLKPFTFPSTRRGALSQRYMPVMGEGEEPGLRAAVRGTWVSKGKPSRRGLINVALNGLVSTGLIGGFTTNYDTREEPDALRITVTRADGARAAAVQTEVLKALGRGGEGAEINVEPRPENEITGAQIRKARKLLGWTR